MRHRELVRILGRAAALAICGLALACGSGDEQPAADPGDAPALPPAETAEAPPPAPPAADDDALATDSVIPESYPDDVPVYPGAAAGPAMTMPGLGVFATFESDDAVADVLDHYRSGLASNGWSVSEAADIGLDAEKEGRSVQVRVRRTEQGTTEIAVNITEG